MKLSKPLMVGASILATLLAGCGGGGGPSPEPPPSQVSLSGNAAKGTLIGADVKAYEIIGGVKSNIVWASGTTNDSGAYTLSGKPTANPVIVEVTTNSTTTMLDETQLEVGGGFKKINAQIGLNLRSFVPSMTEAASVQVNPITEAAVAIGNASVGADNKLTLEVLTAAKQVALQMAPEGTNPFSQKPPLKATEMSTDQIKLSVMMAGLMNLSTENCNLKCQIETYSKGVKIEVDAKGNGKLSNDVASAIQNRRTDLLSKGQMAWQATSNNFGYTWVDVQSAVNSALSASKKNAVSTTTKPASEFAAAEGLEGFISALRNGFKTTENNLIQSENDLNQKYKTMSLAGSQDTAEAIQRIQRDCFEGKQQFECTAPPNSNVKWTLSGNTWKGEVANPNGDSWAGTVNGSIVNGTLNATLNAEMKNSSGKLLTEIVDLKVVISQDSATNSGNFDANGLVKAHVNDSDLVLSLNAKNWKGTLSKSTDTPQKGTLAGEVTLAVSNGDMLSGSIDLSVNRKEVTKNYCAANYPPCNFTQYDVSLTSAELHLTAVNNNSQLLKLDAIVFQKERNIDLEESESNFTQFSADISAALTQSLAMKINAAMSDWSTEKYSVTITSGGSEVKVSGDFTIAGAKGGMTDSKWCANNLRCTSQLDLTSGNNIYTAKLTRSAGKPKGDIYKGTTKVGVIQDGIIQINGREISIY